MPDRRISALSTAATPVASDVLPIVNGGSTKKATITAIVAALRGLANGIAGLDSGGKVPIAQLPAGTASGLATLGADGWVPDTQLPRLVFDVRRYGALGNGVQDERAAFLAAITAATAAKGVVYASAGTYRFTLASHPDNAAYKTAIVLPTGVSLKGDGINATVLKMANAQTGQATNFAALIMNASLSGGATDIGISDLSLDGNNANQTLCQHGIALIRAQRVRHENVLIKNFYGTAAAGSLENFYFEAELSSDLSYISCWAVCTGGQSSSGFSANSCTGVRYTNCVGSGMTVANGFTVNSCRLVTYGNCWAYNNAPSGVGIGFNAEVSQQITYTNCVSGGKATTPGISHPFTAAQVLGNQSGFTMNGTTDYIIDNCISDSNTGSGVLVVTASGTPAAGRVANSIIRGNVIGFNALDNASYDATDMANVEIGGNSTADLSSPAYGYHSPYSFRAKVSIWLKNATGKIVARNAAGTADIPLLSLDASNYVLLGDNTAAAGYARAGGGNAFSWTASGINLAVNTITGYKVRSISANTTLIANDMFVCANAAAGAIDVTLPTVASGYQLIIKKTDGTANAVKIVGTTDGVVDRLLTVPNSSVSLFYDGSAWRLF